MDFYRWLYRRGGTLRWLRPLGASWPLKYPKVSNMNTIGNDLDPCYGLNDPEPLVKVSNYYILAGHFKLPWTTPKQATFNNLGHR